jgi:hypothetical protein
LWSYLVYGRDAGKDVGSDRRQVTGRVRGGLVFRVFIKDGRCPEHRDSKLQISESCLHRFSISDIKLGVRKIKFQLIVM